MINKITDYTERLLGTDLQNSSALRNAKEEDWQTIDSPVNKALYDVVQSAKGPISVGEAGNVLLQGAGEWVLKIDSGPATESNALTTVDAPDDGKRIWFAGSSGALGVYNIETSQKYDYSAPKEQIST